MYKYRHGPRPFVSLFLCYTVIDGVLDFVITFIIIHFCSPTVCLSFVIFLCFMLFLIYGRSIVLRGGSRIFFPGGSGGIMCHRDGYGVLGENLEYEVR